MVGKIACFVVLCMVVVAPYAEAFTCGQVQAAAISCLPHLQNRGPLRGCCGVIRSLISSARTTDDRRTACNCLKAAAATIKGMDMGKAAGLPGVCGVKSPFEIRLSTGCSKVHSIDGESAFYPIRRFFFIYD